jgi:Tol biopolymer transport system component
MRIPRSLRSFRAAFALSFAVGMLLVPAHAGATPPGPVGRIAFDDFITGQIYAVNPDGTGLVQLSHVNTSHFANDPDWTPDGTHVLFSVFRSDGGNARIWIVRANGTGAHQLTGDTAGFRDSGPHMTPDGRLIVFNRCEPDDGVCAIWRMRSDGSHKEALTPYQHEPNEAVDFSTSISPNGQHVAFTRYSHDGIFAQIFVMGIDGSHLHAITAARYAACNPDWAPDGGSLTFLSRCSGLNSQVFTADPDGSHIRQLTHDPYPNGAYNAAHSPDGRQIVFSDDRRYDDFCCVDLFVMDADGTHQHRVPLGDVAGVIDVSWGSAPLVAGPAASEITHASHRARPLPRCVVIRGGPCAGTR